MADPVTYADLDRLLVEHGFRPRPVFERQLAYVDAAEEPIFVFPSLPPTDTVRSYHLATVRRWFLDTGVMEESDFDRWLCGVRFGDVCREPVTAGSSDRSLRRVTD